jgi:hypothetical protein
MGWFDDKKEDAKDAAKEKLTGAVTWPVRVVRDKVIEKYLRSKGKWITGECPQCGKPISGGNRKGGIVHKKCWSDLNKNVKKWEKESTYNKDGTSASGIHFKDCTCNRNWPVHECRKLMGEPT